MYRHELSHLNSCIQSSEKTLYMIQAFKLICIYLVSCFRAHCFPLPDALGQVKLIVGQMDLSRFFFFILYKQIEELQNSRSRASENLEKRGALCLLMIGDLRIEGINSIDQIYSEYSVPYTGRWWGRNTCIVWGLNQLNGLWCPDSTIWIV